METRKAKCTTLFEQESDHVAIIGDGASLDISSEWYSVRLESWRAGGWQRYILFSGVMECTRIGCIRPRSGQHQFSVMNAGTLECDMIRDAIGVYDDLVANNDIPVCPAPNAQGGL